MALKEIKCIICNKVFFIPLGGKSGRKPQLCSNECRKKARLISLIKFAEKNKLKELRYCSICGDSFIAEGKGFRCKRYCSDTCARRAENNKRNEKRMDNAPTSTCPHCEKDFKDRGGRTYCSYKCYIESKRAKKQTTICPICGKDVEQRGNKRKYCSKACSIKAQADVYRRNTLTRRALRKTNGKVETINPEEIFERDGWRCQICGKLVSRRLYKTNGTKRYANAPSIDHIIPISRGGEHIKANVQCACYLCNCRKGNRVTDGGDQLLLFG